MKGLDRYIELNGSPMIHRCETRWSWNPPTFTDYDFWMVLEGHGECEADRQSFPLSSGSAFLFAPGTQVCAGHNPARPLRVFSVHFSFLDSSVPTDFLFSQISDLSFYEMLAYRSVLFFTRGDMSGRQQGLLAVQLLIRQFVEFCGQPDNQPVERELLGLMEAINEDPARKWIASEMARQLHLSRSRFFSRFVQEAGMSPMQYVIHTRISRARSLLRESTMRITEIAEALGYTDVYYFSRQFKKETGFTPLQFRKMNRSS